MTTDVFEAPRRESANESTVCAFVIHRPSTLDQRGTLIFRFQKMTWVVGVALDMERRFKPRCS